MIFDFLKMKANQEKIKKVVKKIVKEYKPEKIILFGSYAWGKPGPDSDVDLFIIKGTKNTRRFARKIDSLIFPRPFPLDIVVYQPEQVERGEAGDDFFVKNVINKGKILYAR